MQADSSGWYTGLIYEVIYIRFYPSIAVMKQYGNIITASVHERDAMTTEVWDVHIRWKYQSTSWLLVAEFKAGNPIELVEYLIANGLAGQLSLKWWVKHTL